MVYLKSIALDVEPTHTCVNKLYAAEVLYAVEYRLHVVGESVFTWKYLVDMELAHNAINQC